jgi:hypothetical protein
MKKRKKAKTPKKTIKFSKKTWANTFLEKGVFCEGYPKRKGGNLFIFFGHRA